MTTKLLTLDRFNWERFLGVELLPEQHAFVPSVLFSLAQARFEVLYPFGLEVDDQAVGFVMYGNFGGIYWINRLLIDHKFQRKGYGYQALCLLIAHLRQFPDCRDIRTSYGNDNFQAQSLFAKLGFQAIGGLDDGETVAQLNC